MDLSMVDRGWAECSTEVVLAVLATGSGGSRGRQSGVVGSKDNQNVATLYVQMKQAAKRGGRPALVIMKTCRTRRTQDSEEGERGVDPSALDSLTF